jgi:hypothetical protein
MGVDEPRRLLRLLFGLKVDQDKPCCRFDGSQCERLPQRMSVEYWVRNSSLFDTPFLPRYCSEFAPFFIT